MGGRRWPGLSALPQDPSQPTGREVVKGGTTKRIIWVRREGCEAAWRLPPSDTARPRTDHTAKVERH